MAVSKLIEDINAAASAAETLSNEDRTQLLSAAQSLVSKLENPIEATIRILFQPIVSTAVRLGVDMKLFDAIASVGDEGVNVDEISSKTTADPLLVLRLSRNLAAAGVLKETGKEKFAPTPLSKIYVSSSPISQCIIHLTHQNLNIVRLPEYFDKYGYINPMDGFNGPFQFAFETKDHCFEWLAKHERFQHAFNVMMSMARPNQSVHWYDYFPVEEKLSVNSSSDAAIVDIGGGVGHDLIALKAAHPKLQGIFVLEDLPVVISSAKELPSGVDALAHDMFTPQPVKSAKAYFLRNVIHDWPDKQASIILNQIRDAMSSESLLLIAEAVMPEDNVPLFNTCTDLTMMAAFSALDRTETQFQHLLEGCGFELVKVWRQDDWKPGNAVVFEAIKK